MCRHIIPFQGVLTLAHVKGCPVHACLSSVLARLQSSRGCTHFASAREGARMQRSLKHLALASMAFKTLEQEAPCFYRPPIDQGRLKNPAFGIGAPKGQTQRALSVNLLLAWAPNTTLTNQNPLFCRVPVNSIYGFILGAYKIVGSGWLSYMYSCSGALIWNRRHFIA